MKIAFHTLGCKVNQYETEAMAEIFRSRGHRIVDEDDFADVYVVNTCTVTAMADRKSRQFIRRMKKKNPDSIIAVTGCYVQIDPESVEAIEGVDLITGINEKGSLPGYVEEIADRKKEDEANAPAAAVDDEKTGLEKHILDYDDLSAYENLGTVTSAEGRTRAYIKVEDGCNRFCAYCVIPYARGTVRSRPLDEIIEEAKNLIAAGYREIVLTGINTALYDAESVGGPGRNTTGDPEEGAASDPGDNNPYGIEKVIAALNELEGDFRIRLSSLEPAVVDAGYVRRLLKYDRLCHHMHLSAQSGSDHVLRAMDRPYGRADYEEIVRVLREHDPCYGISTDIIVGFPGEKATDHQESMGLVENCCFCRTHVFKYSKRPRTKAAEISDQVPAAVKNERSDELQAVAEKAAGDFFEMNRGSVRRVLIEEYIPKERKLCGYTDNYIKVYIDPDDDETETLLNRFADVELVSVYGDGMLGEIRNSH